VKIRDGEQRLEFALDGLRLRDPSGLAQLARAPKGVSPRVGWTRERRYLALDDGSIVFATAEAKKAKKKAKKRVHGASIRFLSDGRGQPVIIAIRGETCIRRLTFPTGEDAGAPQITSSCAVKK
jgi:hypothetical protein